MSVCYWSSSVSQLSWLECNVSMHRYSTKWTRCMIPNNRHPSIHQKQEVKATATTHTWEWQTVCIRQQQLASIRSTHELSWLIVGDHHRLGINDDDNDEWDDDDDDFLYNSLDTAIEIKYVVTQMCVRKNTADLGYRLIAQISDRSSTKPDLDNSKNSLFLLLACYT